MIGKPADDPFRYGGDHTAQAARLFGDLAARSLGSVGSVLDSVRAALGVLVGTMVFFVSGWAAFAAATIGRNIPIAITALCFSLFAGWIALRSVRFLIRGMWSSPATADSLGSGSWQQPWANHGQMGRGVETKIHYNRARLFLQALILYPLCMLVVFALAGRTHSHLSFNLLVLIALALALLGGIRPVLMGAKSDLTAIAWDDHQIRVRTLTSSRQVPWDALEAVEIRQRVVRAAGFIPISRRTTGLVFRLRHNGSRRKVIVPTFALSIRAAEAVAMIQAAAQRRTRHHAAPAMPIHGAAGGGHRPGFGREIAAEPDRETNESKAMTALDAAQPRRVLADPDRVMVAPRGFGKKVM
jgi:hypothetical protein